jgi:hypothetical protein
MITLNKNIPDDLLIPHGYRLLNEQVSGVFELHAFDSQGNQNATIDAAVQAIVDAYDPLPDAKNEKIAELKQEALSRINAVLPAINSFDELELVCEQFLSIAPAARTPTATFQQVIDLYQAVKAGVVSINALTTEAEVIAFDVVTDVAWG